jgi:hypothetical protein
MALDMGCDVHARCSCASVSQYMKRSSRKHGSANKVHMCAGTFDLFGLLVCLDSFLVAGRGVLWAGCRLRNGEISREVRAFLPPFSGRTEPFSALSPALSRAVGQREDLPLTQGWALLPRPMPPKPSASLAFGDDLPGRLE